MGRIQRQQVTVEFQGDVAACLAALPLARNRINGLFGIAKGKPMRKVLDYSDTVQIHLGVNGEYGKIKIIAASEHAIYCTPASKEHPYGWGRPFTDFNRPLGTPYTTVETTAGVLLAYKKVRPQTDKRLKVKERSTRMLAQARVVSLKVGGEWYHVSYAVPSSGYFINSDEALTGADGTLPVRYFADVHRKEVICNGYEIAKGPGVVLSASLHEVGPVNEKKARLTILCRRPVADDYDDTQISVYYADLRGTIRKASRIRQDAAELEAKKGLDYWHLVGHYILPTEATSPYAPGTSTYYDSMTNGLNRRLWRSLSTWELNRDGTEAAAILGYVGAYNPRSVPQPRYEAILDVTGGTLRVSMYPQESYPGIRSGSTSDDIVAFGPDRPDGSGLPPTYASGDVAFVVNLAAYYDSNNVRKYIDIEIKKNQSITYGEIIYSRQYIYEDSGVPGFPNIIIKWSMHRVVSAEAHTTSVALRCGLVEVKNIHTETVVTAGLDDQRVYEVNGSVTFSYVMHIDPFRKLVISYDSSTSYHNYSYATDEIHYSIRQDETLAVSSHGSIMCADFSATSSATDSVKDNPPPVGGALRRMPMFWRPIIQRTWGLVPQTDTVPGVCQRGAVFEPERGLLLTSARFPDGKSLSAIIDTATGQTVAGDTLDGVTRTPGTETFYAPLGLV